jgi:mycofactocin precursor peptide peptidase
MTLLVVPVGATEQHGPHLPLTTDTDIALTLAERCPGALVAPPVAYGSSGEHAGFPGTLSIGREATEHMLVELCRSAAESYARVLLISTHGGNAVPVERAVARLRREGRDVRAWGPSWKGADAHAGRTETSLMLAIAPELVHMERAAAGNSAPLESLLDQLRRGGVRAVSPNGVLGDPTGASADEGRALLASATAELTRFVAGWATAEAA